MDLTNIRQEDYLREKQLREIESGRRKRLNNKAQLTARHPVRSETGNGVIWLCDCDCGNTREIATKVFTSGRVRKCRECANSKRTIPDDAAKSDEFWITDNFQDEWLHYRSLFNPDEQLLYEVMVNGRDGMELIEMEAVDLVMRTRHPKAELETFSLFRIKEAQKRLKSKEGKYYG